MGRRVCIEPDTVRPIKTCGNHCSIWHVEVKNPSYFVWHNGSVWSAWWEGGTQVHCVHWSNPIYFPEVDDEGNGCGFVGQTGVQTGEHKHLTAWGRFTVNVIGVTLFGDQVSKTRRPALQIWVWPNGAQQQVFRTWTPAQEILEM